MRSLTSLWKTSVSAFNLQPAQLYQHFSGREEETFSHQASVVLLVFVDDLHQQVVFPLGLLQLTGQEQAWIIETTESGWEAGSGLARPAFLPGC